MKKIRPAVLKIDPVDAFDGPRLGVLDNEALGAYVRLLSWSLRQAQSSIVNDERVLAFICRVSRRRWRLIFDRIKHVFTLNEDGSLSDPALLEAVRIKYAKAARAAMRPSLRFAVLRRDGFKCVYCGRGASKVELTVDHLRPVAAGGQHDPSNLVTACWDCNIGKSDSPLLTPDVEGVQ